MLMLFLRTFSQALQAFLPLALALTWFERTGHPSVASAIRRGLIVSIPGTAVASWLFQRSPHAALDEALLAAMTAAVTAVFSRRVWRQGARFAGEGGTNDRRAFLWVATTLAALVVVRQTMEIGTGLHAAAIELRLFLPTVVMLGALATGGCIAWILRRGGLRVPDRELASGAQALVAIFLLQTLIYTFHELAEARLLPASDVLHSATEPYGPDGIYGVHLSELLVVVPLVAAAMTFLQAGKPWRER